MPPTPKEIYLRNELERMKLLLAEKDRKLAELEGKTPDKSTLSALSFDMTRR